MRVALLLLLVLALGSLVMTEDAGRREFSGNFRSVYVASTDPEMTQENGLLRLYARHIRYRVTGRNSREISLGFYTRDFDTCENYTVVAEQLGHLVMDKQGSSSASGKHEDGECSTANQFWALRTRFRSFPQFWIHSADMGKRVSGLPQFTLIQASDSAILFQVVYLKHSGKTINVTAALSTSSTLDQSAKDAYLKATKLYNIPPENIRDLTQTDLCPS